jgi:hypothetical protein
MRMRKIRRKSPDNTMDIVSLSGAGSALALFEVSAIKTTERGTQINANFLHVIKTSPRRKKRISEHSTTTLEK